MTGTMSEDEWEQLALEDLGELMWRPLPGAAIAPGSGERESWDELAIPARLRAALRSLNPTVPHEYLEQAAAEILAPRSQDAVTENHRVHGYLTEGYRGITYIDGDGQEQTPTIRLVSTEPAENDWLAVNQVTIVRGDRERRFDVVLYLNGLPVAIIELKRAGSAGADVAAAHAQLQTYLREFPLAFRSCVLVVATDGIAARYGTPFTPLHHFSPWNVDDEGVPHDPAATADGTTALDLLLFGVFNQLRFLQLMTGFVAFDEGDDGLTKRIAKPHQYFAVTKAVGSTVQAVASHRRAGVVWHTQGSGKSMEMELYTNLVLRHPRLANPTIVVVTDRTELDGQLFRGFDRSLLLPEKPVQVTRRAELRTELSGRSSGGIYFTTLQKFGRTLAEREAGTGHPLLSDRHNIVVVVDEAHRSHYDDLDGYARHLRDALPHATLIAFTGTPISFADRNTQEVFGDYIDVYDLTRAVKDGATVPVYFESRLVKVTLADDVTEDLIDAAADEATAGLDDIERDRIERSVAVVNAVYGAPARLKALAADVVAHWETRRAAMAAALSTADRPQVHGKAMIVGATREICARLYDAIVALRPEWHSADLDAGVIKVVYSGTASDVPPVVDHVRRDSDNAVVKQRLKDPDDPLELVIVKDMMLTGYDSPPLHTLYLDRPLRGALLMQTLARVNRTFRGKQDGLLVAYAPLADNLAKALAEYSPTDQETRPVGRSVEDAVALVHELLGRIGALLEGYEWEAALARSGPRAYVQAVFGAVNHLRQVKPEETAGDDAPAETVAVRYRVEAGRLSRAWAIAGQSDELAAVRPQAQFFEEVRVWMAKFDAEDRQARGEAIPEEVQRVLNALVAGAVVSGEVLDIFDAAGMPHPDLSALDEDFLARAREAENPQLAVEALRALIESESRGATRHNLVRQRAFSERLLELMRRYTNQQLTSAEVIAAMIELAREVAHEKNRGADFQPPLDSDELAFYDAVATNESAVEAQGDEVLAAIARDLVAIMRRDVKTDWTVRDDVKAKLRSSIKRLLMKYDYPPDKQPTAIRLVMDQMESMAPRLAA
ncbi:type I restriction endonuclease subunit R [Cellulomonas marina]|uniref:Type I restriction enzyme endonuclease subunit n=1 Tax=Cellulomonas marina TaxID=988821 RepID=A0A1I1A5D8_9CELL|nr:type I restriction endonuclease subunit R [Cellulomonas marina]GIG29573.1 DEAD/DEAH box helicase [Cellulomonas marina]SFB33244.1 type I restriction enzyme, R subunit [Cellulomonas marina]